MIDSPVVAQYCKEDVHEVASEDPFEDQSSNHLHSAPETSGSEDDLPVFRRSPSPKRSFESVSLSSADFERFLADAHWQLVPKPTLMPWQKNPVMNLMFGSGSSSSSTLFGRMLPQPIPVVPRPAQVDMIKSAAFAAVVKRVRRTQIRNSTDLRERALVRWKALLDHGLTHFEVGRLLLRDANSLRSDESLKQSLDDIFASRATGTLGKRGADLMKYASWAAEQGESAFPVLESMVYRYLCERREAKAAATSAAAFRSALSFAGGVLGLDGALDAAKSSRVAGICFSEYCKKRPTRQMKPWTVRMVRLLETALDDVGRSIHDRIFIGFNLLSIYGRLRFSDTQKVETISLDLTPDGGGYLEATQGPGKTASTKEKKTSMMPIAASATGLGSSKVPWAVTYVQLLESEGIVAQERVLSPGLLKSPLRLGGWSDEPVCSSEATAWLRELLCELGCSASELSDRATHSNKATCLSWCGKWGVERSSRKILGYHLDKEDVSMALYSRDLIAPAIRDLDRVLLGIREGLFDPDVTRSGYFAKASLARNSRDLEGLGPRENPVPVVSVVVEAPVEVQESDSDSSSVSSSSSGSDDLQVEEVFASKCGLLDTVEDPELDELLSDVDEGLVVQHCNHGTLHLRQWANPVRLRCGRAMTDNFQVLTAKPSFTWSKCKVCFGGLAFGDCA